ncbi:MAG: DUF3990 domain-containing protein [Flavobacteriaceae bacterium]|jgi:hypothetical protein|nr:DUF3990 domain-containing protein [Flavobacteriaceae bacterium]
MIVYHGSYTEIDEINLSLCEVGRDFGRGFYVTNIRSQAEYWAKRKGKKQQNKGFVTQFEYDESIRRVMNLKMLRFEGYTEEWFDFVIPNRKNNEEQQLHDYDIVEGPVADDDIATRIDDYLVENITKEQFLKDLKFKSPSHQICFCTVQSLQALELQKGKIDSKIFHTDNDVLQTLMIDFDLSETEAADRYYKSKTYTELADETNELYKKPWQEIYKLLKEELKL